MAPSLRDHVPATLASKDSAVALSAKDSTAARPASPLASSPSSRRRVRFDLLANANDHGDESAGPAHHRFGNLAEVAAHALRGGARSAALAFALRGGISFLMALLKVHQRKMTLLQALRAFAGPEPRRFAKMVGAFSLVYKLLVNALPKLRGSHDRANTFVAGAVAGLAVLFETADNRVAVMQQFGIRSLQALYNHLHARELLHIPHGGSLLFILSCASIMYAYVMRPDTLPRSYSSWMIKTARMPEAHLKLVRENVRALEATGRGLTDLAAAEAAIHKAGGVRAWDAINELARFAHRHGGHLPHVPCAVLHPQTSSCAGHNFWLFWSVARAISPVYATLNVVPLLLFKPKTLVSAPLTTARRTLGSILTSTLFLSTFVASYNGLICAQRDLMRRGRLPALDHKAVYYAFGILCSTSIFLERRSRRAELGMFVAPKALQSLYEVMLDRRILYHVHGADVALTSAAMGLLMTLYHHEPATVSPMVKSFMDRLVGRF